MLEYWTKLPSGCPPVGTSTKEIIAFRLVSSDALQANDFLTAFETGTFKEGDACQRCSVSIFQTRESCIQLQQRVPRHRDKLIARGLLPETAGARMPTPSKANSDHWSWWPLKDQKREMFFQVE